MSGKWNREFYAQRTHIIILTKFHDICAVCTMHLIYWFNDSLQFEIITQFKITIFTDKRILLNIKRTSLSKIKCSFPLCNETSSLKRLSIQLRYDIATYQKVFVPSGSVACNRHMPYSVWKGVYGKIKKEQSKFTKEYLEEMFQLLTDSTLKMNGPLEWSTYKIINNSVIIIYCLLNAFL